MIWTHPGMTTYYRNGQGRVFSAMPWRFVDYWAMTHDPDLRDYHLTNDLTVVPGTRRSIRLWDNLTPACICRSISHAAPAEVTERSAPRLRRH